jgi:hypothetical protein
MTYEWRQLFQIEPVDRETHHYDHTHDKSAVFPVDQACSLIHRLGKNCRCLLSVPSAFASAFAVEVVVILALLECMGLFVAQKGRLLGLRRIAAVGNHG